MKLLLKRVEFGATYTIGKLYVDGSEFCDTLEDTTRPKDSAKIAGATSIGGGVYKVIIDMSNRFKRLMPHVLDVPGFEGIRIHSGNTDKDTEGCILLGQHIQKGDFISNSRVTFEKFFSLLQSAINLKEQVTIEIQ